MEFNKNKVVNLNPDEYIDWTESARMIFDFSKNIEELDNIFTNEYSCYYFQQDYYYLSSDGLDVIRRLCSLFQDPFFIIISNEPFDVLKLGGTNAYCVDVTVEDDQYDGGSFLISSSRGESYFDLFEFFIFGPSKAWGVVESKSAEISILGTRNELPEKDLDYLNDKLLDINEIVEVSWEGAKEWMKKKLYLNYYRQTRQ